MYLTFIEFWIGKTFRLFSGGSTAKVVYPSEVPAKEPHFDALKEAVQITSSNSIHVILEKPTCVAEVVAVNDPPEDKLDASPLNLGLENLEMVIIDIKDTEDAVSKGLNIGALKENDLSLKEDEVMQQVATELDILKNDQPEDPMQSSQ